METLEAKKNALEESLSSAPPEAPPTLLHPAMNEVYKSSVKGLRPALSDEGHQTEAKDLLRGLIERIVVHPPNADDSHVLIAIEGDLAGILNVSYESKKATGPSPNDLMQIKLVAGGRLEQGRTKKQYRYQSNK